jgi:hypothetical protein
MTPDETRAVLASFYDALARCDADAMAALYAQTARFEDPIFRLEGADVGRMWKGLLGRAKKFSVSYTIAQAAGGHGTVEWTARYLFGGKNPVVNVILSNLRLNDGLIVDQRDVFDFPRWAAQAMGTPGRLFGRFAWFRRAVSRKAAKRLGLSPSLPSPPGRGGSSPSPPGRGSG